MRLVSTINRYIEVVSAQFAYHSAHSLAAGVVVGITPDDVVYEGMARQPFAGIGAAQQQGDVAAGKMGAQSRQHRSTHQKIAHF